MIKIMMDCSLCSYKNKSTQIEILAKSSSPPVGMKRELKLQCISLPLCKMG